MAPSPEQRFLHQVFRPLSVSAGQPDGMSEQSIPMLILQSAEQFGVLIFQSLPTSLAHPTLLYGREGSGVQMSLR